MEGFHPLIRQWFERTFGAPTETQRVGWPPIRAGQDTLICAPTGTGKTFTAFLALLDDLLRQGLNGTLTEGIQAVYLSPLKALGNDIAVNLQKPLEGIEETCKAAGLTMPAIRVAIRNGDTTSAERARMLNHPPHVLITTPESLYLLLTGTRSCALLVHVRVVIVDELHALLDTKRGAHLSLSLERLRALCTCAPQRIGLSATLASLQAGAAFLAGARDETTPRPAVCIQPVDDKRMTLSVTAPLDDLAHPPDGTIWPALIQNAYEAAQTVRTTLIFVNGRATAEKMAAGL
ncbi:MAG: DEAD/DEAH box helicase [Clostridia bacterium]